MPLMISKFVTFSCFLCGKQLGKIDSHWHDSVVCFLFCWELAYALSAAFIFGATEFVNPKDYDKPVQEVFT